jgi:hypothetical protein
MSIMFSSICRIKTCLWVWSAFVVNCHVQLHHQLNALHKGVSIRREGSREVAGTLRRSVVFSSVDCASLWGSRETPRSTSSASSSHLRMELLEARRILSPSALILTGARPTHATTLSIKVVFATWIRVLNSKQIAIDTSCVCAYIYNSMIYYIIISTYPHKLICIHNTEHIILYICIYICT